jgi:hypothetical protein
MCFRRQLFVLKLFVDPAPRRQQELTSRIKPCPESRSRTQCFGPGKPCTVEEPVIVAAASLPPDDGPLDRVGFAQICRFDP